MSQTVWKKTVQRGLYGLLILLLGVGLFGCGDRIEGKNAGQTSSTVGQNLSEAAPPFIVQKLNEQLDPYQPQVSIVQPRPNEVLEDPRVEVQLEVSDLPIFKNEEWGLGPHLEVILDNHHPRSIYDVTQPIYFDDLEPGTHTLRVFATRPWNESFKNDGAYAQTTFHLFAPSRENQPNPNVPLVTYNSPQGTYNTEPILLDFYLTNAPLHLIAQDNSQDNLADWRVQVTVNGQSFFLDKWQPIYLQGFKEGKNWVRLDFIDEQGQPVENVYNNTVRLVDYDPSGEDSLSQLMTGEIAIADAQAIVDPNYKPVEETPEEAVTEETETPEPSEEAVTEETETPEPSEEAVTEETETPEPSEEAVTEETETPEPSEEAVTEETETPVETEPKPKKREKRGFLDRFRQKSQTPTPSVSETQEPVEETVEPVEETTTEETVEPVEETTTEETVEPVEETTTEETVEPVEETTTEETVEPVEETTTEETVEPVEETTTEGENQTSSPTEKRGFFNFFRRQKTETPISPLPEIESTSISNEPLPTQTNFPPSSPDSITEETVEPVSDTEDSVTEETVEPTEDTGDSVTEETVEPTEDTGDSVTEETVEPVSDTEDSVTEEMVEPVSDTEDSVTEETVELTDIETVGEETDQPIEENEQHSTSSDTVTQEPSEDPSENVENATNLQESVNVTPPETVETSEPTPSQNPIQQLLNKILSR